MKIIQIIAAVLLVAFAGFFGVANHKLKQDNALLYANLLQTQEESASTTAALSEAIHELEVNLEATIGENEKKDQQIKDTIAVLQGVRGNLEVTQGERDQLQGDLQAETAKIGNLSEQVSSITDVVSQIDKLSKTDKELLQKYSKVSFLNEHYIPTDLVLIEDKYTYNPENRYWFKRDAYNHLKRMLDDARGDGMNIYIISAYRSFYSQAALKEEYTVEYGSGANAFSADQGYSEHQLGTTVDITTSDVGASFDGFENSLTYLWLLNNAYKYGFILSYPPNNAYYIFEPWHWRFVGVALATKLRDEGKYFYDEDQRVINEYLISIFDPLPEDIDSI